MNLLESFGEGQCMICEAPPRFGGATHWYRVQPESAQALRSKSDVGGLSAKLHFRQKIQNEIQVKKHGAIASISGKRHPLNLRDPLGVSRPAKELDVCIGLFFGLSPQCRDKDVDNMAKAFLDAIKGRGAGDLYPLASTRDP